LKPKDGTTRITYSVRLNPHLLNYLKHTAIDENKTVGELMEEGISTILQKRNITIDDHQLYRKRTTSKNDNGDLDSDMYDIPKFLRKQPD
jgi:hypothetical protein